jgi:hypothetical protein
MFKLILVVFCAFVLACGGGSGGSSPVAPGGDDDPSPDTTVTSPVKGAWTVTELEIVGEENDTLAMGNPNAAGTAVFTDTDADIDVTLLGQPTVDESGPYTFNTTTAILTVQTERGARTWNYAVAGDILTLRGVRNSGGENLKVKITAGR